MKVFRKEYAQLYDLFYRDKDYKCELELISKKVGFKILKKCEFMSFMILSFNIRNVV